MYILLPGGEKAQHLDHYESIHHHPATQRKPVGPALFKVYVSLTVNLNLVRRRVGVMGEYPPAKFREINRLNEIMH